MPVLEGLNPKTGVPQKLNENQVAAKHSSQFASNLGVESSHLLGDFRVNLLRRIRMPAALKAVECWLPKELPNLSLSG